MGLSSDHAAQQPGDALWDDSWTPGRGEETVQLRSGSNAQKQVKLFTSWFCPFAQRAWIALEEKGVDYDYIEINPYEVCLTTFSTKQAA